MLIGALLLGILLDDDNEEEEDKASGCLRLVERCNIGAGIEAEAEEVAMTVEEVADGTGATTGLLFDGAAPSNTERLALRSSGLALTSAASTFCVDFDTRGVGVEGTVGRLGSETGEAGIKFDCCKALFASSACNGFFGVAAVAVELCFNEEASARNAEAAVCADRFC